MELRKPVHFFILILLMQLLTAAWVHANDVSFYFVTGETSVLRNASLASPANIAPGSRIAIDSQFLQRIFGTTTPTQEQVQNLMLNPSSYMRTSRFQNVGARRYSNDYFFPVTVTTASGQTQSGMMALQYYNRVGQLELRRSDGADPRQFESEDVGRAQRDLVESNTEAETCTGDCSRGAAAGSPTAPLQDVAQAIEADTSTGSLLTRYQNFAREFTRANRTALRSGRNARTLKSQYIRQLVNQFGADDASKIIAAVTVLGEAPYYTSDERQVAETAAILKVIENRASTNYFTRSTVLRNLGISRDASRRLSVVLADYQFSAWNVGDNNLMRMLRFNPDSTNAADRRKMRLAFETQRLMETGRVTFNDGLNNPRLRHYHNNQVSPRWARQGTRVRGGTVRVNGRNVALGTQHLFYYGVP